MVLVLGQAPAHRPPQPAAPNSLGKVHEIQMSYIASVPHLVARGALSSTHWLLVGNDSGMDRVKVWREGRGSLAQPF